MAKKELKLREITPRRIRPADVDDVPEIPLPHENLLNELRKQESLTSPGEKQDSTTYSTTSDITLLGVKHENLNDKQSRGEEKANIQQPSELSSESVLEQELTNENVESKLQMTPSHKAHESGRESINGETGRGQRTKRRPQNLDLPTFIRGKTRVIWDYLLKTASQNNDLMGQGLVMRATRREIGEGARVGSLDTVDKAIAQLQGLGYIRVTHAQGYREGNVIKILEPGFTPSSEETAWRQIAEVLGRSSKLIAEKGLRLSSVELLQWSALADRARRLLNEQEDQGNLN